MLYRVVVLLSKEVPWKIVKPKSISVIGPIIIPTIVQYKKKSML